MPLEQRKKGIALAKMKAKAAPPPASKAAKPAKPAARPVEIAAAKAPPTIAAKTAPAPAKAAAKPPAESANAPGKPPAQFTKPAVAAAGAWRIQLGAFSQRGSAEALYRKLSGTGALAGRHAFFIPVGTITRLQVGPFESKAAASAACKAVGTACFPVPAK